jgi:hypothetical protein
MWERMNPPTAFPDFGDAAHLFRHIRDLEALLPDVAVSLELLTVLVTQTTTHVVHQLDNATSLLTRPVAEQPQEPAKIQFMTPSFDLDTAAYEDIIRLLNRVQLEFIGIIIC